MSDLASRLRRGIFVVVLTGLGVFGTAGCGLFATNTPDQTGNSMEENVTLADAVAEQITNEIPGATVTANYRNDITVPATLALTVRVDNLDAALDAVSSETAPSGTVLDDASRPLAPIAVVAARVAWQSQIDPLDSLAIDVVPGGDPASGDSWNIGVSGGESEAAFNETFGPRP